MGLTMGIQHRELILAAIFGFVVALVGFALRYGVIHTSTPYDPGGLRAEGMGIGLLGLVVFAVAALSAARRVK